MANLLYINRRSGVAHCSRNCVAITQIPDRYLRVETYRADRPRRRCSLCWNHDRPRSCAFAGGPASVTDRREEHPRSGLTDAGAAATPATERAVVESSEVGSSNTRPRASSGTPDAGGWYDGRDLRAFRGYVVNRWTGEVLSSVIADVIRERSL
jgi:hypothetical protein